MSKVNGYVVVEDSPMYQTSYQGIARYPVWPLDSYSDPISILLSDTILHNFCSNPILNIICTPDYNLVSQYLLHCQNLGIRTKLFWIEAFSMSCAKNTVLSPKIEHGIWLGIDYVCSADASYLLDDGDFVFRRFSTELYEAKTKMTLYGLFNSFSDAIRYARCRTTLDTEREGIEHLSNEALAVTYQIA